MLDGLAPADIAPYAAPRLGCYVHTLYSLRTTANISLYLSIMPRVGGGFIYPTVAGEGRGK